MDLHQRLDVFLERLRKAPAFRTAEEALALVCRLIEEVEDEFCPVPPEKPPPMHFSGRMYEPQPDMVRSIEGMLVANTRHHRIWCRTDGGILIAHLPSKRIMLDKAGATDEKSL